MKLTLTKRFATEAKANAFAAKYFRLNPNAEGFIEDRKSDWHKANGQYEDCFAVVISENGFFKFNEAETEEASRQDS